MVVRPSSKVLFLLAVAMGLVLGAAVERASACTCVGRYPACRAFGDSAAVFLGEVVAIADVSRTMDVGGRSLSYRQKRVHFRVSEAFRGTTETELDVLTGVGDGDCGYPFVVGRRYVVFASDGSGAFSTGICQPTQMEAEAEATLA